jgi:hypothetical protein
MPGTVLILFPLQVPSAVYDFEVPLPGVETKWWEVSNVLTLI